MRVWILALAFSMRSVTDHRRKAKPNTPRQNINTGAATDSFVLRPPRLGRSTGSAPARRRFTARQPQRTTRTSTTTHATTMKKRVAAPPRPPIKALAAKMPKPAITASSANSGNAKRSNTANSKPYKRPAERRICFRATYPKMVTPIGAARSSSRNGDSNGKRRLRLSVIHKVITQSETTMTRKNGPAQMDPARAVFDNRCTATWGAPNTPSLSPASGVPAGRARCRANAARTSR